MNKIILFQKKQKKDTIDVWWLSDDGGIAQEILLNILFGLKQHSLEIIITRSDAAIAGYHQL